MLVRLAETAGLVTGEHAFECCPVTGPAVSAGCAAGLPGGAQSTRLEPPKRGAQSGSQGHASIQPPSNLGGPKPVDWEPPGVSAGHVNLSFVSLPQ